MPFAKPERQLLALAIGTAMLGFQTGQAATISVNSLLDDGDGANCTLRDAVISANDDDAGDTGCVSGSGADTIVFAPDLPSPATITLRNQILITSALTIQGPGPDQLTLRPEIPTRHFGITDGDSDTNLTVSLAGLTLSDGYGIGSGGAVFNYESLQLSNCVLSNNFATGNGGAITNGVIGAIINGGHLQLSDCELSNNSANARGGGIFNAGTATLDDVTLQNNTAVAAGAGSRGGGIYNLDSLSLNNVMLLGNASEQGGALFNADRATLTESLVASNNAIGVGDGGGIYNSTQGNLTLSRTTLENNRAESGGGGLFSPGTATLFNVTATMNQAFDFGGGVDSNGNTRIVDSLIERNSAMRGGGIWIGSLGEMTIHRTSVSSNTATVSGGGIANDGRVELNHSQLLDNTAVDGGGIFAARTTEVRYSTVSGNRAIFDETGMQGGDGGGIHNVGGLVLTYSTLSNNTAASGGGGLFSPGDGDVRNSTFSGNQAGDFGGGLDIGGSMRVLHNTLVGNSGNTGGGLFVSGGVFLLNSIVASSASGGDCFVSPSGVMSPSNTLIEDGSCDPTIAADPLLGPLNDNGGPTQTHALLPASPAIDFGTGLALDQRGYPRDGSVDLGSFEFNAQPPPPIFKDGFESPPLFVPP